MRAWLAVFAGGVLAGLSVGGSAEGNARVAMPGPVAASPPTGRDQLNAQCVECHPDEAAQWRGSLHQRAFIDEDFAFAFAREPRPFCRGCHAPEADPLQAPPPALAALGVACVTCHVPPAAELPPGSVLAGRRPVAPNPAPHPVVRRSSFEGAAACGGCHQFASSRSPKLMMQTTLTEHRSSAYADRSCQDCHMPAGADGRRAHGFPASRDPSMLRAALQARATRTGAEVTISLTVGEVGHAFPTGDPFRRLVIELGTDDDPRSVVDRRVLARRLASGGHVRRVVADDRPGTPGAPDSVLLRAPDRAREPLWWRVAYERADLPFDEDDPELFDRVIVAGGRLETSDSPSSP